MSIATTVGHMLAGLIAAIIFLGVLFLVAPRAAAAGYAVRAYLSVKGRP
ncbi:hypothetical protein [Mycobacterium sp. NPDC006124]